MPKNNYIADENSKRLDWDEVFMNIATSASQRTACLYHKVGAVFVDKNHRIISIGYNGPSVGDLHCNEVGCAKIHGDPVSGKIKRCRGVHSEMNALANCDDKEKLNGSTLYITIFPCYDCMKVLNNVGIKKIIYLEKYNRLIPGKNNRQTEKEDEAWELANMRGIALAQYNPEKRIINDFIEASNKKLSITKIPQNKKLTKKKLRKSSKNKK